MALFAIHFGGNLAYYRALLSADEVVFDIHEHFPKQTFRNRMEILGPNGRHKLVIPTIKKGHRRPMGEVMISYEENWQKDHWKGLEAAYRRSPYFEFYEHRFRPFYEEKTERLVDMNLGMHRLILELCGLELNHRLSDEYHEPKTVDQDYRIALNQKRDLTSTSAKSEYLQVFSDRHAFMPNLSVLDALFNLGPSTQEVLK